MRKIGLAFWAGILSATLLSVQSGFAEMAPPPVAPSGAVRIGVAGAVKGGVLVSSTGAVGRNVASGQPIYLGETVTTGPGGRLQILLLDETTFTIGPNSTIIIDKFVYDPSTNAGKVSAQMVKGTFRFVTGKIAKKKPEDMEVKLPSGTIGIRGTIVAGSIDGDSSKIVLLGPGPQNNTGDLPGQIVVGNNVGGQFRQVSITRPGFATEIRGIGQIPTPPAQLPKTEMDSLTTSLAPPAQSDDGQAGDQSGNSSQGGQPGQPGSGPDGDSGAQGQSAGDLAGQTRAEGLRNLAGIKDFQGLAKGLDAFSKQSAQDNARRQARLGNTLATREDLRRIETGVFHYSFNGLPGSFVQTKLAGVNVNIPGTFSFKMNIDFGSRQFFAQNGLSNSIFSINTVPNGGSISLAGFTINPQSFESGTGPAIFTEHSVGSATINVELRNLDGNIAQQAVVGASFSDFPGANQGSTPIPAVVDKQNGPA